MGNELIEAALAYARRGWRVMPLHHNSMENGVAICSCPRRQECTSRAKHPLFNGWRKVATTDEAQLRAWWRWKPLANVGILMGGVTCTLAMDIDGDEGRASLATLEGEHGALPATLTQSTGRAGGGEHRLFVIDQLFSDWIRNRQKVAPGIDFRTEGGFIVGAPSLHSSGSRYRWHDPAQAIAMLPEWLFKFAISHRERQKTFSPGDECPAESELRHDFAKRLESAKRAIADMPASISGDGGHTACFRAAIVAVRGYVITGAAAVDLLQEVFNPRCEPPWTEDELIHKVNSVSDNSSVPWAYRLAGIPDSEFWTNMSASATNVHLRPDEATPEKVSLFAEAMSPTPTPTFEPYVDPQRPKKPRSHAEIWADSSIQVVDLPKVKAAPKTTKPKKPKNPFLIRRKKTA